MRVLPLLALILALPVPVTAQNVSPDMVCFMEAEDGQMIDLEDLCNPQQSATATTPTTPANATPATTPRATGSSSSSGVCRFASDKDSRGRRCGNRASSRRRGGR